MRQVEQTRELTGLGLSVEQTRPFAECLATGHSSGDDCPASMAAYRHAIDEITDRITRMARLRDALAASLEAATARAIPSAAAV